MMKQREASAPTGWLFVGLGLVVVVTQSFAEWSAWPEFRTVLAAGVTVCGLGIAGVGAVVLLRARSGR